MKPGTPRVKMQQAARVGEIIPIKTKIRHPMETGWRKGGDGKAVPRNRLTKFICMFEDKEVLSADYDSGVATDPYLLFYTRVEKAGTYTFKWEGDGGQIFFASQQLSILDA